MRKKLRPAIVAVLALGAAIHASPVEARTICRIIDMLGDTSDCARRCREIKSTPAAERVARWWWTSFYPHQVWQTPKQITSCKVTRGPELQGACRVTFCGPVYDPYKPKTSRSLRVTRPTPASPLQPGLLEGDRGFERQPPAPTGTPIRGSGG